MCMNTVHTWDMNENDLYGIATRTITGYNRPSMTGQPYANDHLTRIPAGTEVVVRELRNGKFIIKADGFWSEHLTWGGVIARVECA